MISDVKSKIVNKGNIIYLSVSGIPPPGVTGGVLLCTTTVFIYDGQISF